MAYYEAYTVDTAMSYQDRANSYRQIVSNVLITVNSIQTALKLAEAGIDNSIGFLQQAGNCFTNGAYDDGVDNDAENISSIVGKLQDTLDVVSNKLEEITSLKTNLDSNLSSAELAITHWGDRAEELRRAEFEI